MCGIGGFIHSGNLSQSQSQGMKLQASLSHRGPDGNGIYNDSRVTLVHTRLSIIDLSESGNQPLYNEDKSIVLICNGEIYNYKEIREELLKNGHQFSSSSDSEVIIHLYEETNFNISKTLSRLVGMFAFAIWDVKFNKLIVARDRVGIKPLYFKFRNEELSFCSEVKPLVTSGLASNKIDKTSLFEYFLTGSIPEPNTYFEDIKSLNPGHFLTWESGQINVEKYWSPPFQTNQAYKSIHQALEDLEPLLSTVVKDHMVADVGVGCFLSAGIDSSLLAYLASQFNNGISTFTASFPGEPENEADIANNTAQKIGATSYNYNITTNFFNDFDYHFEHIDQPFGISSALSLSRISQLARQHVKVVLSGDGADELFGGYHRHQQFFDPPYLKGFSKSVRTAIFSFAGKISNNQNLLDASSYLTKSDALKYLEKYQLTNFTEALNFLSEDRGKVDVERYLNRIDRIWNNYQSTDQINQMLYVDIHTSLVDEMLVKADRMTLHRGLEGRVPFLDHRLVEFALTLPSKFKIFDHFGKQPLRMLVEKSLGSGLAYREKTGFNSPIKKMIKEDKTTASDFDNKLSQLNSNNYIAKAQLAKFRSNVSKGDYNSSTAFSLFALGNFKS